MQDLIPCPHARMTEKLGIRDFRERMVFAVKHGILNTEQAHYHAVCTG